jgi:hypothetical protein
MRKSLIVLAAALILSTPAFATYYVVMKDGSQYRAKARPVVANGAATFQLESGQYLKIDANSIDFAKSDQSTKLGGGEVIGVEEPGNAPKQPQSMLGSSFRLRKMANPNQAATVPAADTPAPTGAVTGPLLSSEVLGKFERAYENVGIFEHKLTAIGPHSLRAEVTADNEEKVFNAISATSFLIMRNAGVPAAHVDMVELFMKTTTGGSSGRFQMTRDDAQALDLKQITREEYFVRKVLY